MHYLPLIARILFSMMFIWAGFGHFFSSTIAYGATHGVPMASLFVPLAGVFALLGGLSILLGYKVKIGAWLIVIFLVPVTFMMHNFWMMEDPMAMRLQRIMFMKNLAMIGGALMFAYFGSGSYSLKK
jgi:Predicted membrane protein